LSGQLQSDTEKSVRSAVFFVTLFFGLPPSCFSSDESKNGGKTMKIKYQFADGTISEIEVNDETGACYIALEREEANYERKCRYHCPVSIDALEYEGEVFADDTYSPERMVMQEEEEKEVQRFLSTLTPKQRQRVEKLMEGMSITEIAREEGTSYISVWESIEFVKKKIKNFFQDT